MYLLYFRHDEFQYLDGLRHIMKRGMQKGDRTGVGTKSVFGVQHRYSLRDGESRPLNSLNSLRLSEAYMLR